MSKRLSDLIDELELKIEMTGDLLLQTYAISDEFEVDKWTLLSKERVLKSGMRAPMNQKEFREHCQKENSK